MSGFEAPGEQVLDERPPEPPTGFHSMFALAKSQREVTCDQKHVWNGGNDGDRCL